jgi:hypothetical protein
MALMTNEEKVAIIDGVMRLLAEKRAELSSAPAPAPGTPVPPTQKTVRYMGKMETFGTPIDADSSAAGPGDVKVGDFRLRFYEPQMVTTRIPSFKDARVGAWPDALRPVATVEAGKSYWLDVTYLGGQVRTGMTMAALPSIAFVGLPEFDFSGPSRFPFYAEAQFAQIARAHGLADVGETYAARVVLAKKYHQLMREHRVEPMKQGVTVYPDPTLKANFFEELVLQNRIAPPVLFGPAPGNPPSLALLQAIQKALLSGYLPPGTLCYSWDEGQGALDAQALSVGQQIRAVAPQLQQLMTRYITDPFKEVVDIFCVVINQLNQAGFPPSLSYQGKKLFAYASCMSNGNCQPQTDPAHVAPRTGFPCFVVETPTEPREFVLQAQDLGAVGGMYYCFTKNLPKAWEAGGLYNEGGNGDGTMLYPDRREGIEEPMASLRLKHLRQGIFDAEWRAIGWSKGLVYQDPNAIRRLLAEGSV